METTQPTHRTKVIAMAVFMVATLILAIIAQVTGASIPSPWEWTLLMLATFGMARIITSEKVGEPLRDALADTHFDEIINCPRCTGMWVAIGLLATTMIVPAAGMVFLVLFSLAGVNIFVQQALRLTEHLSTVCYNLGNMCEPEAPKPDLAAFNKLHTSHLYNHPINKNH